MSGINFTKIALNIIGRAYTEGYVPFAPNYDFAELLKNNDQLFDLLNRTCFKELAEELNCFSESVDIGRYKIEDLGFFLRFANAMYKQGWRVSVENMDNLLQIEADAEDYIVKHNDIEGIAYGEVIYDNDVTIFYEEQDSVYQIRTGKLDFEWYLTRRFNPNLEMHKVIDGSLVKADPDCDMTLKEDGKFYWNDDCYYLYGKICDFKGNVKALLVQ